MGVDICAVAEARKPLKKIEGILRPRQKAVYLFSEALRDGHAACPPYTPILTPKIAEAPRAPQYPIHTRAAEAERDRRRRNAAKTVFSGAEKLARHYLRYVAAGGIVGAWAQCSPI